MKNYREYIRERKDVLHDKEEKIGYIRSKLGLNHEDGMSEPEDDTEFTYVNDKQRNEPNDRLMAQLHDAEFRGMEADYAAKKMAVKANEAEYEKDKLEKKIDKLDKTDDKLEKMIKKIRKAISGKDEEESEESEEQQTEEQPESQNETTPEESAPEEGSEETKEESPKTEEGEEGDEEESEEDEGSKNILSKKLDLSWRQRKGNVIREGRMLQEDFERSARRLMRLLKENGFEYELDELGAIIVEIKNEKVLVEYTDDDKWDIFKDNDNSYSLYYEEVVTNDVIDYLKKFEMRSLTKESHLRRGSLIRECRRHQRMHHLFERLHKERVIRDGKTKIKYKTDRADDGFKVSVDNDGHAREVKMTTQEIIDRKKQQKRAQRKRDPKLKQMTRNRLRSARIRKMKGFDD